MAAALDETAKQTGHKERVVTDVFSELTLIGHAAGAIGTKLCDQHIDHARHSTSIDGTHPEPSIGRAELGEHIGDVFCDALIADAKLTETPACKVEKETVQTFQR